MAQQHLFSNIHTQSCSWRKTYKSLRSIAALLLAVSIIMPVLTVNAVSLSKNQNEALDDEASSSAQTQPQIIAQSADSATASSTTLLKQRLQRILGDQDASSSGETQLAGYIGEVTRVSEEALAVKTPKSNQIIPIDEELLVLKRNKPMPVADISVGNWVIVVGNRVKNGDIAPSRVLVQTVSLEPKEHLVSTGTILSTSSNALEFIPRGQSDPMTLLTNKNSTLLDAYSEPLTLKEVPTQISAIVVAKQDTNGKWFVSTLKTMVGMDEFKSSTPTPTAKPTSKSTPTPKPSATPKATPSILPTPNL